MKIWRCMMLAIALACVANAAMAAPQAEPRIALVIGNSAYAGSPLTNPVNDARAIAAALKLVGFDVDEAENVKLKDMERAIIAFGRKLRQGGVGLFYYAGHGLQVKGLNYLVPVDAQLEDEASVRVDMVPVDLVTEQMGDAANRINVIVLDACRNNPFERRLRGGGRGLAAMDAATGTLIAYATAPGSVAADGEGKNGLYTGEFLKALQLPGLKVEDVFKRVRVSVMAGSHGEQTPWETSSLTGDFYFRPPASAAPAPPPEPAPTASGFDERQLELAYWKTVKESSDPRAYESYLKRYPKGTFADLAQLRIAELTQHGAAPPIRAEATPAAAAPAPPPTPSPPPSPPLKSAPPAVAALPPPVATPETKPPDAKPTDGVTSGRWRVSASGACSMSGDLLVTGKTVKAKLGDTVDNYDIVGEIDDSGHMKAYAISRTLYSITGHFPDALIGAGGYKLNGSGGFCNGVAITLKKLD